MNNKREINIAEKWERAYDVFQQINFKAWDYKSIKESLLDYVKLYFPEDFNDYIESSEFIAILELFAYVGELLAYRVDMNAHENILTVANRKESVLRLAKFLSYRASRNSPSRGLVKITSINTSESVVDSSGNDLTNKIIRWNDPDNSAWKEQFLLVMNRVMEQDFGTVLPTDRKQVQDILFELYSLKNNPVNNNVLKYSVSASDRTLPMELVSSELTEFGPIEKRPEKDQKLNILYSRDGLGDSSSNTGFFFLTKQGTLKNRRLVFDGVLPNQSVTIDDDNINDIDVWLNNVDSDTGDILIGDELYGEPRKGEWQQVDVANTQNVLFNTSPNRNKYEIETLDNDNIKLIFGDGNFSNIPKGEFDIWYRTTSPDLLEDSILIPTNSIQNKSASFKYSGADGRVYTFAFTFSLFTPMQNSSPSETIDRIRSIAPSVYYTQDRMVNGRDYNEFMLQDNSILKLRSINRTFSGDSKYIGWHDPKEYYENVKLFGNDLVVYFRTADNVLHVLPNELPPEDGGLNAPLIDTLILNHIQPILEDSVFKTGLMLDGLEISKYVQTFTGEEIIAIETSLLSLINSTPNTTYLTYHIEDDQEDNNWSVQQTSEPDDWHISIESQTDRSWVITYKTTQLVVHSDEVRFTVTNEGEKVITYDTLSTNLDKIVILGANVDSEGNPLSGNYDMDIMAGDRITTGLSTGLCDYHSLIVLPSDRNRNGISNISYLKDIIGSGSYVYFRREDINSPWIYVPYYEGIEQEYEDNIFGDGEEDLWKRERGIEGINFLWLHRTPRYHLIDPSATNIIDSFIISRGYYNAIRSWLSGRLDDRPSKPTSYQLRSDYGYLIDSKMISDTVILQPGDIKVIIGKKADDELQATIKVVKSETSNMSNNRIKNEIINITKKFFDINEWNFGQPFYFTNLASKIHNGLGTEINSVVLVPKKPQHTFGSLYQIIPKESEILQVDIQNDDIEIVESLDPLTLSQRL